MEYKVNSQNLSPNEGERYRWNSIATTPTEMLGFSLVFKNLTVGAFACILMSRLT